MDGHTSLCLGFEGIPVVPGRLLVVEGAASGVIASRSVTELALLLVALALDFRRLELRLLLRFLLVGALRMHVSVSNTATREEEHTSSPAPPRKLQPPAWKNSYGLSLMLFMIVAQFKLIDDSARGMSQLSSQPLTSSNWLLGIELMCNGVFV